MWLWWVETPWIRIFLEVLLGFVLNTTTELIRPINSDADTVGKWLFVAITIIFNIVVLIEVVLIAGSILTTKEIFKRHLPRSFWTVVLMIIFIWQIGTDSITALAQFDPQRHITGLPTGDDHAFVFRLRMANMVAVLMGPGGYGRYFPSSLGAEVIIGYVLVLKIVSYLLSVSTVVGRVLEYTEEHQKKKNLPGNPQGRQSKAFRKLVLRDGNTWTGFVVELVVFGAANFAVLGLCAGVPDSLAGPIIYSIVTGIALLVLCTEVTWVILSTFTAYTEFKREKLRWYSGMFLLLFGVLVYSMVFTAFPLYHPSEFWARLSDNVNPFELWLRMAYTAVVFMVPGGYGLEFPVALSLELTVIPLTLIWVLALLLVIDSIVSQENDLIHQKSHKKRRTTSSSELVPSAFRY